MELNYSLIEKRFVFILYINFDFKCNKRILSALKENGCLHLTFSCHNPFQFIGSSEFQFCRARMYSHRILILSQQRPINNGKLAMVDYLKLEVSVQKKFKMLAPRTLKGKTANGYFKTSTKKSTAKY